MLKSELIYLLSKNLATHGDSEIKVELVKDLNENGKVYDIGDITNALGLEFEADYITVFDKEMIDSVLEKSVRLFTNEGGLGCYRQGLEFYVWSDMNIGDNDYEVFVDERYLTIDDEDEKYYMVHEGTKVEFNPL